MEVQVAQLDCREKAAVVKGWEGGAVGTATVVGEAAVGQEWGALDRSGRMCGPGDASERVGVTRCLWNSVPGTGGGLPGAAGPASPARDLGELLCTHMPTR